MIRLNVPKDPFDIELAPGITITVKPVTPLNVSICKQTAQKKIDDIVKSAEDCRELGMLAESHIDLSETLMRDALYHTIFVEEMALKHIVDWSGVLDESGEKVSVTPDAIRVAMTIWPFTEMFYSKLFQGMRDLSEAKKDSGVVATGTSNQAAAPNTAPDAENSALLVPTEA